MSVHIGKKYHVCLDLAGLDRTAYLRLFPAIAVPQNKPGVSFIAVAPGALHAPMAMVHDLPAGDSWSMVRSRSWMAERRAPAPP